MDKRKGSEEDPWTLDSILFSFDEEYIEKRRQYWITKYGIRKECFATHHLPEMKCLEPWGCEVDPKDEVCKECVKLTKILRGY